MRYKTFILLPSYGTNTYLVWDDASKEAILIDPASESKKLLNEINKLNLVVKFVVNTHGHGDHIGGNDFFKKALSSQLAIHKMDADMLIDGAKNLSTYMGFEMVTKAADIILNGGELLKLGDSEIKVISTPGHSKGGICLYFDNILISGDTLFAQSVGRSDLPGGDHNTLVKSIKEKLLILPNDTIVLPGHGAETTIGHEKRMNPFVGDSV